MESHLSLILPRYFQVWNPKATKTGDLLLKKDSFKFGEAFHHPSFYPRLLYLLRFFKHFLFKCATFSPHSVFLKGPHYSKLTLSEFWDTYLRPGSVCLLFKCKFWRLSRFLIIGKKSGNVSQKTPASFYYSTLWQHQSSSCGLPSVATWVRQPVRPFNSG